MIYVQSPGCYWLHLMFTCLFGHLGSTDEAVFVLFVDKKTHLISLHSGAKRA